MILWKDGVWGRHTEGIEGSGPGVWIEQDRSRGRSEILKPECDIVAG